MNIITLHCCGEEVYFNVRHIIMIRSSKVEGSFVVIPNREWQVDETPEQILRLIKGQGNGKA